MTQHKDPLRLLEELIKHPRGLQLAHIVSQLRQDSQGQTPPERGLVARALNLADHQGIKDRPYFNDMANDEIREWIAQHSPKQEVN